MNKNLIALAVGVAGMALIAIGLHSCSSPKKDDFKRDCWAKADEAGRRHCEGPLQEIKKGLLKGAYSCGVERASVKHLTDGFVLPSTAKVMTPDELLSLKPPQVGQDTPRITTVSGGSLPETILVVLNNVHVIAVKQEADSDLHVIIQASNGKELNVEAPQAICDSSSKYAKLLGAARAAMDKTFPNVSSSGYTTVNVTATIEGVLFWDVLHGQRGAPNGVELHPVVAFDTGGGPLPVTTTTGTTTTNPTTTQTTTSTLPGCDKYPGRFYFNHVKQNHCAANFFTTP